MPYHRTQLPEDIAQLDALADRILRLNPTCSLAYSAKANAAFSSGNITTMMLCKENAIRCARYTTEEYLDYFDKLYTAMMLYQRNGAEESAQYCRQKLFDIAAAMERVTTFTDPLAYTTGDDSSLTLPDAYQEILNRLS